MADEVKLDPLEVALLEGISDLCNEYREAVKNDEESIATIINHLEGCIIAHLEKVAGDDHTTLVMALAMTSAGFSQLCKARSSAAVREMFGSLFKG